MGSIRRKTATKPIPDGAEFFQRSGRKFARWKAANGKSGLAPVTVGKDGSERIVVECGVYLGKFRNADGHVVEQSTGCRDKQAAAAVVAQWERRVELVKAGVVSRTEDRISDHQQTPLADHFAAYLLHLEGSGCSPLHRRNVTANLKRIASECEFAMLSDITAEAVTKWMLSAQKAGLGARTRNLHRSALMAFCGWCVDSSRLLTNPLLSVVPANEQADRRHVRRALTHDEIKRLLDAAECRPLLEVQTVRRGPKAGQVTATVRPDVEARLRREGRERRLLYSVMLMTGLRKSELKSLTIGQVHLDVDSPFIELNAADAKNRQTALIPLRQDLASHLRDWIADRKNEERPATLAINGRTTGEAIHDLPLFRVPSALDKIIARDFTLAGIARRDDSGRVVDAHSLRVTFCTMLSRAGIAPRTAQELMRHSDMRLTTQLYTDARLLDVAGAVASLPDLPITSSSDVPPIEHRATGTFSDRAVKVDPHDSRRHGFQNQGETVAETSARCEENTTICVVSDAALSASQAVGEGSIPFTRFSEGSLSATDSEPFPSAGIALRPTDFAAAVANIMALPLTDAEKAEWCILRLLAANEAGAEGRAAR